MTTYKFKKTAGGNYAPIKRDHKAVLESVELFGDMKEDRNGNPYATFKFNFAYNDDQGGTRQTGFMTTLPYSLGEGTVAKQILELAGVKWSEMKEGDEIVFDTDKFKSLDCVIHIGAELAEYNDKNGLFKEGQPKVYEKDGELKLSSGVIGVYPLSSYGKTWTERMDQEQTAIVESFKTMKESKLNTPDAQPGFEDTASAFDA